MRLLRGLALLPLQPILARIVRRIASRYPEVLDRLGPHKQTRFVIDPVDLPFALYLRPDPDALDLRAIPRGDMPEHDAKIAGKVFRLLRLIDCDEDGDAMFFSRDLDVTGDIEAVVTLRNALDDVDGSIAGTVAGMFGPPGEAALAALRRFGGWKEKQAREQA
jgi:predicted lipid carrier protein YhbT